MADSQLRNSRQCAITLITEHSPYHKNKIIRNLKIGCFPANFNFKILVEFSTVRCFDGGGLVRYN